eukprot:1686245-Amphidinium_carterae.2
MRMKDAWNAPICKGTVMLMWRKHVGAVCQVVRWSGLSVCHSLSGKKNPRIWQSQKGNVKSALNAAFGGALLEARSYVEFGVGELCVRCGEGLCTTVPLGLLKGGRLSFRPAPWRRLLVSGFIDCFLHPGIRLLSIMSRLWLPGVVFILCGLMGSGRYSSNPHFRACGVGYYIDIGVSVWLPFPGLKQSVYRAEFLVNVRALEKCKPKRLLVIAKAWFPACSYERDAGNLKANTGTLRLSLWPRFRWGPNRVDEGPPDE